jgi:hypothetical protein
MIRRLTFASCYVYSPRGSSAASERSRLLRNLLKSGDARFILKYAVRVRQQAGADSALAGFFGPSHVLVPVPGCAATVEGGVSVAEHLARAMIEAGIGRDLWKGLYRIRPVRKSATAMPLSRPTVGTHFASFAIDSAGTVPPQLVLIDDVVTKGRTLLAAAARLKDAAPQSQIRAFALLRTMGLVAGVERLLDPCVGEIRWRAGDAHRSP